MRTYKNPLPWAQIGSISAATGTKLIVAINYDQLELSKHHIKDTS
jgi:hypothetical protein